MIDLHIHTTHSDGIDPVVNVLKKANEMNLEVISITDHDTCKAYKEMDKLDLSKLYKGKIINGCEFTTSFKGRLIEVMGYGMDFNKVDKYLSDFYKEELVTENTNTLCNRLLEKIRELGLTFEFEKVVFGNDFFERIVYDELINYEENKTILKEDILDSFGDFYRKGLTNPNSELFINHAEFKLDLKSVVDLVHSNGGILFLAHPYQYKYDDTEQFLEELYDENDLDGVECYYTTFSKEQTDYLIEFTCSRNLLISGGSDYHGSKRKNHELGIGNGKLNIDKSIIDDWNISFYKE